MEQLGGHFFFKEVKYGTRQPVDTGDTGEHNGNGHSYGCPVGVHGCFHFHDLRVSLHKVHAEGVGCTR